MIILTAKDTIDDKVEFLRGGADDYVTKPFDIKEVTARVEVQIRRQKQQGEKRRNTDLLIRSWNLIRVILL